MSKSLSLKAKDLCNALDIERHQLRVWVEVIPLFSRQKTKERSATQYKMTDLFFFAVVKHIHQNFGVPISFIANFSDLLYACIIKAEGNKKSSFVFISKGGSDCRLVELGELCDEGMVVSLQPARKLLFSYLGLSFEHSQMALNLMEDTTNDH